MYTHSVSWLEWGGVFWIVFSFGNVTKSLQEVYYTVFSLFHYKKEMINIKLKIFINLFSTKTLFKHSIHKYTAQEIQKFTRMFTRSFKTFTVHSMVWEHLIWARFHLGAGLFGHRPKGRRINS